MKSMTGFGRAELRRPEYKLQIELASVNSRFLECVFRMPRVLAAVEGKLKEVIAQKVVAILLIIVGITILAFK